ncbi:MAG TPA: M28 family peptidase [Nannocystis sp.]
MRQPARGRKPVSLAAVMASTIMALGSAPACERPPAAVPGPADATTGEQVPGAAFSGERAHERVAALLALPRSLGHPQRASSIDALDGLLRAAGASSVGRLEHTGADPWTRTQFAMTTLIAHVRPQAPRQFVLATHFDVRPWAESDPDPTRREQAIPGANDGTSGVAVLLELAPLLLDQLPQDVGFSLILFDGEELGRPGDGPYCAGSRALAQAIARGEFPEVRAARFGVVLDMVGDADLQLLQDPRSRRAAAAIVDEIWSTGQAAGFQQFVAGPGPELLDDHVALTEAGVPSLLLIDYSYPAWHTHADDLSQISAASLGAVGETLRRALRAHRW